MRGGVRNRRRPSSLDWRTCQSTLGDPRRRRFAGMGGWEPVELAAEKARLDRNRVLTGLPHPSGANAERIAFFLGRKERQALSPQVRPERLIAARTELKAKIAMLAAEHVERAQQA